MPMNPADYPPDWKAISTRLRNQRAGNVCEHPGCGVSNRTWIYRKTGNLEQWTPADGPYAQGGPGLQPAIKVVLTVAHVCGCRPLCGREDHLVVLCQLHHLRLDARQHGTNSRETRRTKKLGPALPGMDKPL